MYGCIHGHRYTHGRHPRGVGSVGLFLSLSRSSFVHGAYGDHGMCSYNLFNIGVKLGARGLYYVHLFRRQEDGAQIRNSVRHRSRDW